MSELSTPKIDAAKEFVEPSALERMVVKGLAYVPGMRKLASSRRMLTILRGSTWTMAGYAGIQLLRFAATLVLARKLLSPQAFGLVALVNVFLGGLDMLSDLGLGMDVVQHRRGDEPAFVNTAFLIQAGRGTIIWLIATALAYPFAYFYHQPSVCWLAMVGALSVAVRGVASGSIWLMTRHVQIGKLTALTLSSEVAGFLVSVAWAIASPTAWALVAGRVAASIVFTVGSHLVAKNRVSLLWDRSAARDIFIFGTGIFLSTATYFLGGESERLVIGKFISMAELGCFSLALTLAAAPSRVIQQVVGQVFFPVMANSIRKDREAAAGHFRSARYVFLALGIAISAGFIAYSHRLVAILLPPKYAMTAWMLQFMGFRAGQEIFAAPSSSLILACGDSKYAAAANTSRLALMVSGVLYAFSKFGIHQAVAVLAVVPLITYPIVIWGLARHLRRALWVELASFALFIGASGIAAILPWPWA
jgi:O-antigen/teichoic acid export membrane protein